MKKLLAVLVVLAACVIGFGFYRGWFAMSNSSTNSPAGNDDVNINLSMDKDKFNRDVQTVKDKASELTGNSTEEGPRRTRQSGQRQPQVRKSIIWAI